MSNHVENDFIFNPETSTAPLGIVATEGATELSEKIDAYLVQWANVSGVEKDTFIVKSQCPRFSSAMVKVLSNPLYVVTTFFIL